MSLVGRVKRLLGRTEGQSETLSKSPIPGPGIETKKQELRQRLENQSGKESRRPLAHLGKVEEDLRKRSDKAAELEEGQQTGGTGKAPCLETLQPANGLLSVRLETKVKRSVLVPENELLDVQGAASEKLREAGLIITDAPDPVPIVSLEYAEESTQIQYRLVRVGEHDSRHKGGTRIGCGFRLLSPEGRELLSTRFDCEFKSLESAIHEEPEVLLYRDVCSRFRYYTMFRYLGALVLTGLGKKSYTEFLKQVAAVGYPIPRDQLLEQAIAIGKQIGPDAWKEAVPILVEVTEKDWPSKNQIPEFVKLLLKDVATWDLEALGPAIGSSNAGVRAEVVSLLGEVGPTVLDIIKSMLSDEAPSVRVASIKALQQIGGDTEVPAIVAALEDPSADVRSAAAGALTGFGDVGIAKLVEALQSGSSELRKTILTALQQAGPRAEQAVPTLTGMIDTLGDKVLILMVLDALLAMETETEEFIARLTGLLSHDDPAVRMAATGAIGRIGPRAEGSLSSVLELLERDQDPGVRMFVARMVGEMSSLPNTVVAYLDQVVAIEKNTYVRQTIARSIHAIRSRMEMNP